MQADFDLDLGVAPKLRRFKHGLHPLDQLYDSRLLALSLSAS